MNAKQKAAHGHKILAYQADKAGPYAALARSVGQHMIDSAAKKRKPRRVRAYMVYALIPVNVRVLARSKRGAERMGLRALNRTRPLELSSDDNATYQAMYLDGEALAVIDESMTPSARVVPCSKSEAVTFINEEAR